MNRSVIVIFTFLAPLMAINGVSDIWAFEKMMAPVGPGVLHPLYPPSNKEKEIPVQAFWLDRLPVTNGHFLEFVKKNQRWRRDKVSRLFADPNYLAHWEDSVTPGIHAKPGQPVVNVSWFAAKAYCEWREFRLPTENEWELAASADETKPDGRDDPMWLKKILEWYSRPTPKELPGVGVTVANYWGIFDLHGLVWEWVLDFNAALVAGDGREGGDAEKIRFCGSGALAAADKMDYASFMRIAFRSSLRANYTTANLGFRCATDREN